MGEAFEVAEGSEYSLGVDDDGTVVIAWTGVSGPHAVQVLQRFRLTCVPGYEQRCSD